MAATIQCPKCGFEQVESKECLRCGVIFSRMHRSADVPASDTVVDPGDDSNRAESGGFRRYYRIFRWVSLFLIVIVMGLILCDSSPPEVETTPDAIKEAQVKFREFQSNIRHGNKSQLELDQPELNGWIRTNLAIQDPADPDSFGFQKREEEIDTIDTVFERYEIDEESLEIAKSTIRDLKVELLQDTLRLYALFETYGVDLSLEIEGRLLVRDGYLRLEPIDGRLGSLPLPSGTLQRAVDKLLESPENRDKFRLPPNIRNIKIDGGRLVVSSR